MFAGINMQLTNDSSQSPTVRNPIAFRGEWIRNSQSPMTGNGGTTVGKVSHTGQRWIHDETS